MKKIDKNGSIAVELRRTLILAKLGTTLLILSMLMTYRSLLFAIAENNVYYITLYSALLIFQALIWIWNVFL